MMEEILKYSPIIIYLIGAIGLFINFRIKFSKIQDDINQLKECSEDMSKDVDDHKIKLIEISKDKQYENQIVNDILTPAIDKMNGKLLEYVDLKMRLVTQEIEQIKTENQNFKNDLKEMLKEFKDHTEKTIDRISTK
jgi:hypothetical protein